MHAARIALIVCSIFIISFHYGCDNGVGEAATASAADSTKPATEQSIAGAEYYPAQPCTFEYTVNVTMLGHQSPPQTIIVKALERLQVDDRAYTKWVTPDLDGAITTRYSRVSHDGVYVLSGNWERLIIPFPMDIGSRWNDESFGECVVDGYEDVVVPAGQYSRCLKIRYSRTLPDGSKLTGQRYVAPGVGDVRFTEAVPGVEAELILKTRTVAANWVEGSVDDTHSALCEAQTLIGRWYSRCDDSLITSGPKEFSTHSNKRLLEWKDVNCRSITANDVNVFGQDAIRRHSTISDADRMNGIDVKSVIAFYSTAYREGSMTGEWGKWQAKALDEQGKAKPFAIVTVKRENGKMIADLLHSGDQTLKHGYEPVNCDWIVAIQQHRENEGTFSPDGNPPSRADRMRLPLTRAAYLGDVRAVTELLASGVEVDAKEQNGRTALAEAILQKDAEIVKLLLDHGASLKQNEYLMTSDVRIATILLERGADPNWSGDDWTWLHEAAATGATEVARLLIQKGAKVNALVGGTHTPLDFARENKHPEVEQLLLQHGGVTGKSE